MATPGPHGAFVGQRFGKYDLLALLAVGGTAEIYLARIGGEAGFEKFVVVKCMLDHLADQPKYVRMFLDEARIGAQLDHSNIVQTLELGEHEGRYYTVMEYLAGMSLAAMAQNSLSRVSGGLPLEVSLCLCAQACAGLHYAHKRTAPDGRPLDILHRDVSPQNLVVSFEGVLKLVAFGLDKPESRDSQSDHDTLKDRFAYLSPEQCQGRPLDRRTDIFSLGTILHELLTGQYLFKRGSTHETREAIMHAPVTPPSRINRAFDSSVDAVVMRALARDRAQRYPSAEAFGEALLALLHQRGKSIAAGDVAQFFDENFAEEIEIHAERMRELVTSGRATLEDLSWHAHELVGDSDAYDDEPAPRAANQATLELPPAQDTQADWTPDDEPTRAEGAPDTDKTPIDITTTQKDKVDADTQHDKVIATTQTERVDADTKLDDQMGVQTEVKHVNEEDTNDDADETTEVEADPLRRIRASHSVPLKKPGAAAKPLPSRKPLPKRPATSPPSPKPPRLGANRTAGDRFPPIHTPAPFKRVAEAIAETRPSPLANSGDVQALAIVSSRPALWLLLVAFVVSAAVGLGLTLAVMQLFG